MSKFTESIFQAFRIYGDYVDASPYGSGHINDTYAVNVSQSGSKVRYLFQRVNHLIFKDVPGLMENIRRVTEHAEKQLHGVSDASRKVLKLIRTHDDMVYHVDSDQNYWRCYLFIESATGYDIIETTKQAYEAAKAFGEFQKLLVDLPGARLNETIPDFHNTPARYQRFKDVLSKDSLGRAVDVQPEIDWVLKHEELADALLSQHRAGLMPERVTHNDTKLNNVLIDDVSNEASCVIDLDTLMPGLALYDFGDLVRTSTSPVAEDEKDFSKVFVQIDMFEALVKGYLESAGTFLTEAEQSSLILAGQVITMECGVRFLTDYLEGDVYFKTKYEGHNVDRCRTQFALVDDLERNQVSLNEIIHKYRSL
ncbi:MAG: aminoglycoside phosphotransferase family protein [Lentisphaeria bacterium]|nr:aminoglycoside phosphotransferase family protein [Lentisphaeria bacterium]